MVLLQRMFRRSTGGNFISFYIIVVSSTCCIKSFRNAYHVQSMQKILVTDTVKESRVDNHWQGLMIIGEVVLSAHLHMSFLTRGHKCIINYRVETNIYISRNIIIEFFASISEKIKCKCNHKVTTKRQKISLTWTTISTFLSKYLQDLEYFAGFRTMHVFRKIYSFRI